jgi:hypothetical protein
MEARTQPQITCHRARGLAALACDPGPCGSCNTVHSFFVCREGKSQCVECDKKEREAKAKGATA